MEFIDVISFISTCILLDLKQTLNEARA